SMSILNLVSKPGKIVDGQVNYKGQNLLFLGEEELRQIRGNEISMIFQEPVTSLNPVFKIGRQIMETIMCHQNIDKKQAYFSAVDLLEAVGIADPVGIMDNYPHQLSGGMCQRVMISIALACKPKILIADEPTTSLDVTIQAQILKLLKNLKKDMGTAIILITHDMGVVAQMADNVMVMYAGQAVEYADVKEIFANPMHPYTVGLLNSIPKLYEDQTELYNIKGMVPGIGEYPDGCRFSPRCEYNCAECSANMPQLENNGNFHYVRCFKPVERGGI
ncbi:ABC transporter ATP-binding protein, partial [Tyzzerella sp. OttesenSCG-928-J15]|nr:ABC transporter ATP-binding protein [Tyzzerella sp. OttesenSCG-928-J15]